jgi:transcriptional regulator with XRE-family HTH domain
MYPNLKIAIFKRGIHQNQISKVLGINEANLSKIIRGYREPSETQRVMLAKYLEMDAAWLFEKYENDAHAGASRHSNAQRDHLESGRNPDQRQ